MRTAYRTFYRQGPRVEIIKSSERPTWVECIGKRLAVTSTEGREYLIGVEQLIDVRNTHGNPVTID